MKYWLIQINSQLVYCNIFIRCYYHFHINRIYNSCIYFLIRAPDYFLKVRLLAIAVILDLKPIIFCILATLLFPLLILLIPSTLLLLIFFSLQVNFESKVYFAHIHDLTKPASPSFCSTNSVTTSSTSSSSSLKDTPVMCHVGANAS